LLVTGRENWKNEAVLEFLIEVVGRVEAETSRECEAIVFQLFKFCSMNLRSWVPKDFILA